MKRQTGLVHIYCGDGKGKTSAAMGLALRAAGRGMRVVIARFLKTDDSGEVAELGRIPGIYLFPCEKCFGFTFRMKEEEKQEAKEYYRELFRQAGEQEGDVLILDEIIGACNAGLVEKEELERFLAGRPPGLEVVLTGRNPWEGLLEMADYVTEMRAVRHPYQRGIRARKGIEY